MRLTLTGSKASISEKGFCYNSWEMPLEHFERYALVCVYWDLTNLQGELTWTATEIIHRGSDLPSVQRPCQALAPRFLLAYFAPEMVPN